MLDALRQLGVALSPGAAGDEWLVTGAPAGFPVKEASIFLGNAGTAFRSLTAVLALGDGRYRLHGVPRMHERPIGDLVDALRQAGARVAYDGNDGFPPLAISPREGGAGATVRVRGEVSSQYLTGLLLALGATGGGVRVEVVGELISRPYVEMTLALMARFGVRVDREGWGAFVVPAGARYRSPGAVEVEGDASSASYFLAAGLLGDPLVRRLTGRDEDHLVEAELPERLLGEREVTEVRRVESRPENADRRALRATHAPGRCRARRT
jgi:3-phosphoshikimate 1-carboxyvinyltransferase